MVNEKIRAVLKPFVTETLLEKEQEIEVIKNRALGDYASNIAFLLAQKIKKPAPAIAQELKAKIEPAPYFDNVTVGGKGFLNFTLAFDFLLDGLKSAGDEGFGKQPLGKGKRIIIEYISANPTGPLSVVQARAGALGNALANLLRFSGFSVHSEFYVNDSGTQVELLYQSLLQRIREQFGEKIEVEKMAYPGTYLIAIAQEIIQKDLKEENWQNFLLEKIITLQKTTLNKFSISFDSWTHESSVIGKNQDVIELLTQKGLCYEKDGAKFFRAQNFGDREDRVLVTSDSRPTYFLTDLSYHLNKFERGFDQVINIWGPDHHGYIPRMAAGLRALGYKDNQFKVIISQQVSLSREGKKVGMSKRAGEFITLDEVLEEINPDALKFFLLMRTAEQHLSFDLELTRKTSKENPVYYVQYAYARICSIIRFAQEKGLKLEVNRDDLELLKSDEERNLILEIIRFPDVIRMATIRLEPHRLVYYAIALATAFHLFYEHHRVVSETAQDQALTRARLFLCLVVKKILAQTLNIIGVSAPKRMTQKP